MGSTVVASECGIIGRVAFICSAVIASECGIMGQIAFLCSTVMASGCDFMGQRAFIYSTVTASECGIMGPLPPNALQSPYPKHLSSEACAMQVKLNLHIESKHHQSPSSSPELATRAQSIQTVAPTTPPKTQKPEFSATAFPMAPLVVVDVAAAADVSVPFGSVPFRTTVLVPFTGPTCTRLWFCAASLPFPISESRYVEFPLSSHPHALYIWHKQVTGNVSFCPAGSVALVWLW